MPADNNDKKRGSDSCPTKTACYAATCWIPFVGVACLACGDIKCSRSVESQVDELESFLPANIHFDTNEDLSINDKLVLIHVLEENTVPVDNNDISMCLGKYKCYITCVGELCILCEQIKC